MKNLHLFFLATLVSSLSYGQCTGNEPTINLGNDTVLCFGQNLTLSVPPGYDFYQWSNGATGTSINVNQPGTYSVTGGTSGTNQIILNGDFENGTTAASNNFTTAYVPGTGGTWGLLSSEGQYAISTSPSLVHNNFSSCGDHTTGTGNMLIVNGSINPNTNVWSQTVTVNPNENYVFSFWAMSAVSGANVAQLQLSINNIPISAVVSTNTTSCIWNQVTGIWNSGSATSANLSIFNQATAQSGNDFAIDDIFFANNCVNSDTIQVSVEFLSAFAGSDQTFCPGEADTIFGTTNSPANTLIWDANGIPGDFFIPDTSGTYVLTAISPAGCTYTDDINITIKDMNWDITDMLSIPTDCGLINGSANSIIDTIDFTQPDPLPFSYQWSGPGSTGPNIGTNPNINNLSPGWYYLTVSSDGCIREDSVEVTASNGPTAAATATPTTGFAPLDVNFDNQSLSASSYTWIFDTISTQSTTNTNPINQTFSTPGTYQVTMIATNGNCHDTVYLTIIVLPPPVIPIAPIDSVLFIGDIPNVFSPNGDLTNDIFTFEVSGAKSFSIDIYNRWGNILYSADDPLLFGWNGFDATEGVYFYKMNAKGYQNEERSEHGYFHLVK